jgi:hypothetical protein
VIVTDYQKCGSKTSPQPSEERHNLGGRLWIQGSRRLIRNYQNWLACQRLSECDTLTLTSTQLVRKCRINSFRIRHLDLLQQRNHPFPVLAPCPSGVCPKNLHNLIPDPKHRI